MCPGAHQGIVDPATFAKAQELASKGRLSAKIIDSTKGMACSRTLWRRFGGVMKAYELIGYEQSVEWGNRHERFGVVPIRDNISRT
jgi:hypothetical protein